MTELIVTCLFITLGFIGAYVHYFKKRYIDETTQCTLLEYLKGNLPSTLYTIGAIIFTEVSLAAATTALSIAAIVGALTAGYTSDSIIDRAPDSVKVGFENAIAEVAKDKLNSV